MRRCRLKEESKVKEQRRSRGYEKEDEVSTRDEEKEEKMRDK